MLVPDTNVYIGEAAGSLSADVQALLDRALLFHCVVCVGELATGVANGDPSHPRWAATRDHYSEEEAADRAGSAPGGALRPGIPV